MFSPLSGALSVKIGTRVLLFFGLALMTAGLAWIALVLDPAVALWVGVATLAAATALSLLVPGRRRAQDASQQPASAVPVP